MDPSRDQPSTHARTATSSDEGSIPTAASQGSPVARGSATTSISDGSDGGSTSTGETGGLGQSVGMDPATTIELPRPFPHDHHPPIPVSETAQRMSKVMDQIMVPMADPVSAQEGVASAVQQADAIPTELEADKHCSSETEKHVSGGNGSKEDTNAPTFSGTIFLHTPMME